MHCVILQGISDLFGFVWFAVFFAVVFVQFVMCFRSDYKREPEARELARVSAENGGASERTPLLSASRESLHTETSHQAATELKRVRRSVAGRNLSRRKTDKRH